ncbi:zinc finger protein 32-like [Toxorhynchites rutilus septentrionalis]|uniref:zinc finger protein 32-like n=1 Tax=Toxorhynchites rutilus septentrionalis TaxID=329112 RepID=UPI002479CCA1|nr:zinc finger protein 32-like [Toxorhynchites rutilus septentrionalis]
MSQYCAMPGCQSQIGKTIFFSVTCTAVLSEWWTLYNGGMTWYSKRDNVASLPYICIDHFRPDQLERAYGQLPRLREDAVPSIAVAVKEEEELILPSEHQEEVEPLAAHYDSLLVYCRFCGKKQKQPITNHIEDTVESEDLLQLCLGRGRFVEGFPTGVCDHCLVMIRVATSFISDCGKAQETLQHIFFGTTRQMEDPLEMEDEENSEEDASFTLPDVTPSKPDDPCGFRERVEQKHAIVGDDRKMSFTVAHSTNGGIPGEASNIRCNLCNKTFKRRVALTAHMESIHEKRTFTCPTCGKTMGWRKTLQRHMKSHEENFQKYNCGVCEKTFSRLSHLRLHMVKHTGQKINCPLCGSGQRCKFKLVEHIIKMHQLDKESAKMWAEQAALPKMAQGTP